MLKFKEKIFTIQKLGFIIPIFFYILCFLILTIMNYKNIIFLPIILLFFTLCIIITIYRFNLHSNIFLSNKMMLVPNKGYNINNDNICGQIKILNGRLFIPYNEITNIKIKHKTVYISYMNLSSDIVLHPLDLENFIISLKEKLISTGHDIHIHHESDEEHLLILKNDVLTNGPTLAGFAIIISIPNLISIYNLITSLKLGIMILDSSVSAIITLSVAFIFFISIFELRSTIILSNTEIIETNSLEDTDISQKRISYEDIKKIRKTKWRVEIESKNNIIIFLVSKPKNIDIFYSQLQDNVKKIVNK